MKKKISRLSILKLENFLRKFSINKLIITKNSNIMKDVSSAIGFNILLYFDFLDSLC